MRGFIFGLSVLTLATSLVAYFWPIKREDLIRVVGPDRLVGLINTDGRVVLELEFEEVHPFVGNNHAAVKKEGKWGLLDREGRVVVHPEWDDVSQFGPHGLARVARETDGSKLYGWVDQDGGVVIPPVWRRTDIHFDSRGMARVEGEDGIGWIDTGGNIVVPTRYNVAGSFDEEGMAMVELEGEWGWIDRSGETVIPCAWALESFEDRVIGSGHRFRGTFRSIPLEDEADYFGKFEAPTPTGFDHHGICLVWSDDGLEKEKVGFIYRDGTYVKPQWKEIRPFDRKGMAPVNDGSKWGWINTKGEVVIEPAWDECEGFEDDDLAAVKRDGKWGWVNREGAVIIEPQWEIHPVNSDPFELKFDSAGMAIVRKDGKCGWIDREGTIRIPLVWDNVTSFDSKGLAAVGRGGYWGWIDRAGEIVIEPQWESLNHFGCLGDDNIAIIKMGNESGWINREGQVIMPLAKIAFPYGARFDSKGMVPIHRGRSSEWLDKEGNTVIRLEGKWSGHTSNSSNWFDANDLCIVYDFPYGGGALDVAPQTFGSWVDRSGRTIIELPEEGDPSELGSGSSWQWYSLIDTVPSYDNTMQWDWVTASALEAISEETPNGYVAISSEAEVPWIRMQLLRLRSWLDGDVHLSETQTACIAYDPQGKVIWDNRWVRFEAKCLLVAALALFVGVLANPFGFTGARK